MITQANHLLAHCVLLIVGGISLAAFAAPPGTITDEAKVPPYTLSDPLVCLDGARVTHAKTWREKRRPELMHLFENEMYGKTLVGKPANLKFVVREEKKDARGGKATRLRVGVLFEGKEDGRQMELLVYLPNDVKGPVPILFGLSFDGNFTTTDETDIPVPTHWVNGLFDYKPKDHVASEAGRGIAKELWQYDLALSHGYAVATAGYGQVEPDADGHWKDGPRGLAKEPGPGDWGQIGAWAWAYSRAADYFETNPRIDAKRIGIHGFSRIGKAAVWAGAQDERFAMVVSLESGGGGIALSKRIFGETVENLSHVIRWFCPNFAKYAGKEADLPMDQHELAALIAPRPLLINSAAEDLWSDPKGEFLSGLHATPVYRLLGAEGMTIKEWPGTTKLVDGTIGYFMRPGPHNVTLEDWQAMMAFADNHLKP